MAFADPQGQRASSSSISTGGRNYDVFLSFRGEDTRHNFTDHLYRALNQKGIHTFRDAEELRRGEEIAPELLKAIEESRICLIILSQNYARSRWCLDELAKIMQCKEEEMGKLVFPIFYYVDPSQVRKQEGSYGQAFSSYERNADEEGRKKIESWRKALAMLGNIAGWALHGRPEAPVIEEITSTIWKRLNREVLHVEKNLVGMDRQRASSSSTSIGPWDYEVFLGFRGEDTFHNFTDHLYAALYQKGIRTFRDNNLKGEELTSSIFKAIEKSRCILVILSKHFAHSRWCLGELVKIIECKNQNGKLVIPIFYHVKPSDVRNQMGSYGEAFAQHESRNTFGYKAHRWREALTEVANLSGWHVENGSEADAIEEITSDILGRLNQKFLHVEKNLVGIDSGFIETILQMINPLLNDVLMVGICGLGGIGKTTIAKVLFNHIASDFMITSFIADVREHSERNGLLHLQKQLLHDSSIKRVESPSNVHEAIPMIKAKLCFKKVLLVLDDVDNSSQLEALAGDHNWFGPGSRIIITTRDKHLLGHEMDALYEAKKLDHEEAVELFSWHAFNQNHPKECYKTLSNSVVRCVDGLPLGLKVLGRFLCGKTVGEWESELHKLKQEPNQEILSVLKRSYDELDSTQKQIFLDVACFFNGEDKDFVIRILDACNFHAEGGIRVLIDKCLVTILDNKIWMHDLLQQIGRDIVQQESPEDPGKRSRLCCPEVISRVLTRKMGTKAIKGILFNLSIPKRTHITTESFAMMNDLRLLKIYSQLESTSMRKDNRVKLSKDFEFPSYELRYLYWQGYPLESLPSSFDAEDLVELDMCYSSLKQLWENDTPREKLNKLNTIRLSCSQHLIEIPDISAPNLEKLILDGCSSLLEVHPSIGKLSKLILLSLKNCKKLSSFPSIINMEALQILNFSGCSGLKKFPDIQGNMEHLLELYLASTTIEELPSSIGHLTGLVLLDLKRCTNLKSLPTSICKLESLNYLFLSCCSKLENFPEMMEDMENLKELLLDGTSIEGLPLSIDRLKGLVLLNLRNCKNLVSLPKGMCKLTSLETLIVSGCSLLNNLPRNLGSLQRLVQLHADGTAITQPPDSIVLLRNLEVLVYPGCKILTPTSLGSLFSFWLLHSNGSNGIGLRLPSGFSSFKFFTNLDLSGCKLMEGAIPNGICSLISLKKLDLSRNNFLSIPAGISELTNLKDLRLGQCQSLIEIPELAPSVRDIDAHNCTALLLGSSSVSTLQGLQFLFCNCSKQVEDQSSDDERNALQRFPHNEASSSASVSSLTASPVVKQKLLENIAFSIVFPGTRIPEWILHQNEGSSIKIELPTDWYNDDFLGFALCSVLEHLPERIICHLNSDVFDYGDWKDFGHDFHWTVNIAGSEHVWLGYQPCSQLRLFQFNDPNDWNHIEISFEAAHRFNSSAPNVVKKCGVCLIYTEDLEGMHPQNRKQLKSKGCTVVERSSDIAGPNRSGIDSSSSASSDGPTNDSTLKLKRKRPQE